MTTSPRTLPRGLVLCAICLLLNGLAFLAIGFLFLVAPASLRDAGFGQDVSFPIRVAGLLVCGGVGALFAWPAWGLMRLNPFALEIARGMALAMTWAFATRIVGGDGSAVFDWLVVVVALAMTGYLTLPSVRVLFQPQNS